MLSYTGVSSYAAQVDGVVLFIVIISGIILAGLTAFTLFCLFRYQRQKHPVAADIDGNVFLELTWTIVPTIIVMIIFYYGWQGYGFMRAVPKNAMKIDVEAKKWSWMFQYANNKKSGTLKVPVGKPVKLLLQSRDVIHSLYIPAFRIKEDVVPGRVNYLWFNAIEEGTYDLLCAEYCGDQHSVMLSKVEVMDPRDFQTWYDTPPSPEEIAGELVKTCLNCHSLDESPRIGPGFKGIFGRKSTVITAGQERTVIVDEEYLERSMLEPAADVVKGYDPVMPEQNFSEEELKALIQYMKGLK